MGSPMQHLCYPKRLLLKVLWPTASMLQVTILQFGIRSIIDIQQYSSTGGMDGLPSSMQQDHQRVVDAYGPLLG